MKHASANTPRIVLIFAAVAFALGSAFFVFYTGRLLYVTRGLGSIRAGGGGAYVGALVFPLLAIGLGWGARRCALALRGRASQSHAQEE